MARKPAFIETHVRRYENSYRSSNRTDVSNVCSRFAEKLTRVSPFRITFYDDSAIPRTGSGRKEYEKHKIVYSSISYLARLFFQIFFNKKLSAINKLIEEVNQTRFGKNRSVKNSSDS